MKLIDVCELIVDCPHSTAKDEGQGIPLVRTPNIGKGRLELADVHRVSETIYNQRIERATPKAGDLILAREAPVGNVALIMPGQKVCLGQRVVLIRPDKEKADPAYLTYYLLSEEVQHRLKNNANGAVVAHLNMNEIRNLEIGLPNISDQKRIAGVLSSLDDKIALNNRINHSLEEQADCLISSAIETQAIGCAHLSDICSYVTERVNCDTLKNENYISTDNMLANRGGVGIASTIPRGKCTSFTVRDVLVSNIRPYFKKIWRASFSGGCSNDVLCFRTTIGTSSFLYHLLRSDAFFEYVMSGAKGSKMPRGDKQHIMNWEIPVFDNSFIATLEGSLEAIDDRVAIIREENRRLIVIRDSLLPKLMNNCISINDLAC